MPPYKDVLRLFDARRPTPRWPLWPLEFRHTAPHSEWMLSYHESGHAVVASVLGVNLEYVEFRYKLEAEEPVPVECSRHRNGEGAVRRSRHAHLGWCGGRMSPLAACHLRPGVCTGRRL